MDEEAASPSPGTGQEHRPQGQGRVRKPIRKAPTTETPETMGGRAPSIDSSIDPIGSGAYSRHPSASPSRPTPPHSDSREPPQGQHRALGQGSESGASTSSASRQGARAFSDARLARLARRVRTAVTQTPAGRWLVLVALVTPVVGIVIAHYAQTVGHTSSAIVIVTLIVSPLVLLLIASGFLSELTGPGGISLKLRVAANAPVGARGQIEVLPLQVALKGSLEDLDRLAAHLKANVPTALVLAEGNSYNPSVLATYLERLKDTIDLRLVVLVDQSGAFIGSVDASRFQRALHPQSGEKEALWPRIADRLQQGEIWSVLLDLGPLRAWLSVDATTEEALALLQRLQTDALVVIDPPTGRPRGVVTRDELVTSIVLTLVSGATKH